VGPFHAHPVWHPDGSRILANCYFPGESHQRLTLIDAETGEWSIASHAMVGWGHPSYSPSGKHMVVDFAPNAVGGLPASLDLIDVETDTIEQLASLIVNDHTHQGTHLHPVWSPDGKQILFASDQSGLAQLCLIDLTVNG
jgi:Tol biopolymer transport system component